jgi:site-specific recombinase XerC
MRRGQLHRTVLQEQISRFMEFLKIERKKMYDTKNKYHKDPQLLLEYLYTNDVYLMRKKGHYALCSDICSVTALKVNRYAIGLYAID